MDYISSPSDIRMKEGSFLWKFAFFHLVDVATLESGTDLFLQTCCDLFMA
jgi:hypothetical protein